MRFPSFRSWPDATSLLGRSLAFLCPVSLSSAAESAESAAVKWAELRTEAAQLESDWQWQRLVLEGSAEALRQRLQKLEEAKAQHLAEHQQVRNELQGREAENAARRQALEQFNDSSVRLTQQVLALQRNLPPRLRLALELPLRQLADARRPAAERVQWLTTIESRCSQFNRTVTYSEETIELAGDASRRLYEVLYWGLAAAYALDRDGQRALIGFVGPEGWTWRAQPELVSGVQQLLAIHRDQTEPQFIALPMQLATSEGMAP